MAAAEAYWRRTLAGFTAPTPVTVARRRRARKGNRRARAPPHPGRDPAGERACAAERRHHQYGAAGRVGSPVKPLQRRRGRGLWRHRLRSPRLLRRRRIDGRAFHQHAAALRAQVDADAASGAWLRELQAQAAEMRAVRVLAAGQRAGLERGPARQGPVRHHHGVRELPGRRRAAGTSWAVSSIRDIRSHEQTNFPITLVSGPGRELGLKISYDRSRFDARAIRRHARPSRHAPARHGRPARPHGSSELVMLPHAEARRNSDALRHRHRTAPAAGPATLHEAFEAQVRSTPDAARRSFPRTQSLTYAELNRRANALARAPPRQGVGPEQLVGLHLERRPR